MQKVATIIFRISVFMICFWIITSLIRLWLQIDFKNFQDEMTYEKFRFFAFPVAILCTLFGKLKKEDERRAIVSKIISTVAFSILTLIVLAFAFISNMCQYTTKEILFENKQNPSVTIALRDYGCGAWDSDPPNDKAYKMRSLPFGLIMTSAIDTTKIDKNEWIKK